MSEYVPLLVYLVISMVLSMLILSLSFVFSTQKADPEKVSAYECGFDPFDDARARFDIRFYLVAILFIIFDLEACVHKFVCHDRIFDTSSYPLWLLHESYHYMRSMKWSPL